MTFIKDVSGNSDAGSGTEWGGNDIMFLDKLFDDIDITPKFPKVNTDFRFRDLHLWIRNPANTFDYKIKAGAISADRQLNLPVITGTDTLAVLGLAQTMQNKTLDSTNTISSTSSLPSVVVTEDAANSFGDFDNSWKDNRVRIWNPADTFRYTIIAAAIEADRNVTLPLLTGNDTFVTEAFAQTLTNKTIAAGSNTITGLTNAAMAAGVWRMITKSGTLVDINTTSAEQTIFTQSVSGNTMGANGILHCRIHGAIQQNQASATNFTLRIKFGGTTYYDDLIASALAQSATILPFVLDFYISNNNVTNAQRLYGIFMMNDTVATPTTGSGDLTDDEIQSSGPFVGTPAKDTTSAQTLAVTMQMSVSNAAVHTFIDYTMLEVNPS